MANINANKKSGTANKLPFIILIIFLLAFDISGLSLHSDKLTSDMLRMIITRCLGGICMIWFIKILNYYILKPAKKSIAGSILVSLPCALVVINNLPVIALLNGTARITAPLPQVLLLALQCLSVGLFEEAAFRGVLLPVLLEGRRQSAKGVFFSVILSSTVFGLVHIFNLFAGAGFFGTILQVGYSFLLGGMLCAVMLTTHNLWLCVLLHAVYNFCGLLLPTLGTGSAWNTPTVIITAALAAAVAAYVIYILLKLKPHNLDGIYGKAS